LLAKATKTNWSYKDLIYVDILKKCGLKPLWRRKNWEDTIEAHVVIIFSRQRSWGDSFIQSFLRLCFYSAFSSPLLLRSAPDYSIDTHFELKPSRISLVQVLWACI